MKPLVILLLLFILTLSGNSYAKKLYYPIEVVASIADLIVVGEIESVNLNSYDFKISKTIKGQEKVIITVQMFKEWKCDTRMKKADKGQKLFLFLTKNGERYEIVNGSTGEMFIENDKILRTIGETRPTVTELSESIQRFTSSYEFKGKEYSPFNENTFIQKKTNDELKEIVQKSELTKWFFDRMKNYRIEK
jgi:hypothetical protein